MLRQIRNYGATGRVFLLGMFLSSACRDVEGPTTGEIRVAVSTTGAAIDRDPDGYILRVEGGPSFGLPANGLVTIPAIAIGSYELKVEGVAANCSVAGGTSRSVEVDGDPTAVTIVSISVVCGPNVGNISITTITSGVDHDPDGYSVTSGTVTATGIPASGTRLVAGFRAGSQSVTLTGLSGNCMVTDGNPKTVSVTFGVTAQVAFAIQCVAAGGVLVKTATTGTAVDTDGYSLELRRAGAASWTYVAAASNGTAVFTNLLPGEYNLSVLGLAANCDPVVPSPRTLAISAGSNTPVDVDIVCAVPAQLALVTETTSNNFDISLVSSAGTGFLQLTSSPGHDIAPAWSPDRTKIAFASARDGNLEIYVMDANGQNPVRLTNHVAADRNPEWSPDGSRIVFESDRESSYDIYVMNADGTNVVRLTSNTVLDADPAWSPDGTRIAFASERSGTRNIWVMKADGSDVVRLTTIETFADSQPAWSPDGSRIAYTGRVATSNRGIFMMFADGSGRTRILANLEDASGPTWSPDGRKIAFVSLVCYYGYFYQDYCDSYLMLSDVNGGQYWSTVTNRVVNDVSWQR